MQLFILNRLCPLLLILTLVAGCSAPPEDTVLSVKVERGVFNFAIPAKGELVSAREVPITSPAGNIGTLTLAWLAEENSLVKKGEVVARFDGSEHELQRERALLELRKNQLSKGVTERSLNQSQFSIEQQSRVVNEEMAIAEQFTVDDLMVYSKNEIIDQMLNKEYLESKQGYLRWRKEFQVEQSTAELELLSLRGRAHSEAIALHDGALASLEVVAPRDGILLYDKNWRGEKVRVGQALWPGSKIASIPSLDEMQANIYVLESEAAGLEKGQGVELVLDAFPDIRFTGAVENVANIAAPRAANSPVKYFEVGVRLERSDPEFMKPGQKLSAKVMVATASNAITVPNQAVFKLGKERWVYLKKAGEYVRQPIEIGLRSLTLTQVVNGLKEGDEVALMEPLGK